MDILNIDCLEHIFKYLTLYELKDFLDRTSTWESKFPIQFEFLKACIIQKEISLQLNLRILNVIPK